MCPPPPSCASPAHGGAPSPSAGLEYSVQQRWEGVEPVGAWAGPVGSEWVGWKLGVWEQVATAVPGDGEHLLERDASAPLCPRRHG